MEQKELFLDTMPDSNNMWENLGGNYENAEQSINELVDNAISNIIGNNTELKKIQISLEETDDDDKAIIITIEDSGLGIEDAEQAFTLGSSGSDSVLNEHGFGLLQALAAANKQNDAWDVYKRSPDNREKSEVMHIMAPYVIGKQRYEMIKDTKWPGHKWGNTFIRVRCDHRLFTTLLPIETCVRSSVKFDFETVADRIHEDLGFTYSYILADKKVELNLILKHSNGIKEEHKVTPIIPRWTQKFELYNESLHLNCNFGQIDKLPHRIPFDNRTSSRYYQTNLFTSGVELRINGRAMEYNKFEEIFGKKNHPCFNSLMIQVDIVSESRSDLPATRTTKNGFRVGDERLEEIYKWIRKSINTNQKTVVKPVSITETEEKKKLAQIYQENYDANQELEIGTAENIVSREAPVFKQLLNKEYPKIDLLVNKPDKVTVIEAKKGTASILDLYQMMMYCDGYYVDHGKMPDEAILVAKEFPDGVRRVLGHLAQKNKDRYPEFEIRYWNHYQENFEESLVEEKKLRIRKR